MLSVLNITAPLFLLIGCGYLAVRFEVIPAQLLPGVARFVLYFCVPGVIINNFLKNSPTEIFEPDYVYTYGLASLLTLLLITLFQRWVLGRSGSEVYIFALGSAIPNSMFIGFPVLLQALPEVAAKVLVLSVLVENLIVMPIALFMAEYSAAKSAAQNGGRILAQILRRLISNPLLIAICIGLILSALNLSLPEFMLKSLDMLAGAAAAAALIVIGGSLVGNDIRGDLATIGLISSGKLLLHPLAVILVLALWPGVDSTMTIAMILIAASPMLTIFPILGSSFGAGKTCASTLLVATLLSFFTLNGFLAIYL